MVRPDELDLHRFTQLWSAGRAATARGELEIAEAKLRMAASLWRGTAGHDVPQEGWVARNLDGLNEYGAAIVEDVSAAEIAIGKVREAIPRLGDQCERYPTREKSAALLLVAQYRTGDIPAALNTFTRYRDSLMQQIGVEPGQGIKQLHLAVLRREDAVLFSNQQLLIQSA